MPSDDVADRLRDLSGNLPAPRSGLSEGDKDELVRRIGPRTARDIVRAAKDFPQKRIAFLFSSVDTQAVVDLLANDVAAAIERAIAEKAASRAKTKKR